MSSPPTVRRDRIPGECMRSAIPCSSSRPLAWPQSPKQVPHYSFFGLSTHFGVWPPSWRSPSQRGVRLRLSTFFCLETQTWTHMSVHGLSCLRSDFCLPRSAPLLFFFRAFSHPFAPVG